MSSLLQVNSKSDIEVIRRIVEKSGSFQFVIAMEEMSELIKELSKYLRGLNTSEELSNIAEECADVYIMLLQIMEMLPIYDKFCEMYTYKIDRLRSRLNEMERSNID